mmetsp:Transcript_24844/g.41530  ORF Transcript_24844/g.41530 Transcript_24844/m.41530 type:complete len:437 (-) Transcript_24844:232-1542(-)|eukprot:CAMPEP_0198198912 /NCGR_PEP_ID=MMETSP1445-20131203/2277_1 /TAXON_ID=36898 /ORGANISM="Pyramimonas sp., Strain CCMP2087" /LENGTH=436 /DNA_ID=CAMNT_0043868589 /DNA_START=151 /DNA_END=1461 /DNA_ORIENTATION=+
MDSFAELDTTNSTYGMRRRQVTQVREQVTTQARKTVKVLQALDAFPKVNEDYAQYTNMGATVTLACFVICMMLFASEVVWHRTTVTQSVLSVDNTPLPTSGAVVDKMNIYLDITFPRVSCSLITLDTTEVSGERHMDVHDGHILKRRLNSEGIPIEPAVKDKVNKFKIANDSDTDAAEKKEDESLAVAKPAGHNPMMQGAFLGAMMGFGGRGNLLSLFQDQFPEGIEKAFRNENNEGCEVVGYLEVNRVAGQFHISPGKSLNLGGMTVQLAVQSANLNMTHTIKKLAFGEGFPGAVNPLDGQSRQNAPSTIHQYFLKVVPTTFVPIKGDRMSTNQFSVTESINVQEHGMAEAMGMGKPPGVYFTYELSPIRVSFTESRPSLGEFFTSVCAIIGGVFSLSGLVHMVLVSGSHLFNKKKEQDDAPAKAAKSDKRSFKK